MHEITETVERRISGALGIIQDGWEELQRSPCVQLRMGITPARLPEISLEEAQRRSASGQKLLTALQNLNAAGLPHDLALSLRLVRFRAYAWSREADWYWNVVDPLGIGFFGMFLPTAYCGGHLLNCLNQQLAGFTFNAIGDTDRYLALISDYGRLVDQFTARTLGQERRGIRIPRVQLAQARSLLTAFKDRLRKSLGVEPRRLTSLSEGAFLRELERRIARCVEPAFNRALEALADSHCTQAPVIVGLSQYPRGREIYAELVKLHTTLDLTPQQVHDRGLGRMSDIERDMRGIEAALGGAADSKGLPQAVRANQKWRAETVGSVSAMFQKYIDRMKPQVSLYFSNVPRASYGVAPLPESLQDSMTFGYYDPPRPDRDKGLYLFNATNLTQQPGFNLAALVYHELVPGHHLHLATQQENKLLHRFRANSFVNAYNEGWAEYAAALAGEIGMYQLPEERYGRLMMDAFLTSRLVVDTGLNAFGWSIEEAREYMREYSGLAERDILTETVRYSCDIPGQALAYKLGDSAIMGMRERMRGALNTRFDLKTFHEVILGAGALPLPDLDWHVDREIERLKVCS